MRSQIRLTGSFNCIQPAEQGYTEFAEIEKMVCAGIGRQASMREPLLRVGLPLNELLRCGAAQILE